MGNSFSVCAYCAMCMWGNSRLSPHPRKIKNNFFTIWGAFFATFSPYRGLFATFFSLGGALSPSGGPFHHLGAIFLLFLYVGAFFVLMRGPFLGSPYKNFRGRPWLCANNKRIVTQKYYQKLSNLVHFVVYLHKFCLKKFHKLCFSYINIEREIIILQPQAWYGVRSIFLQKNLTNGTIW